MTAGAAYQAESGQQQNRKWTHDLDSLQKRLAGVLMRGGGDFPGPLVGGARKNDPPWPLGGPSGANRGDAERVPFAA